MQIRKERTGGGTEGQKSCKEINFILKTDPIIKPSQEIILSTSQVQALLGGALRYFLCPWGFIV